MILIQQSLRPAVMRRLMKEIAQLKNEPLEGIRVSSPDEDMLDVTGIIEGPGECRVAAHDHCPKA